MTPNVAAHPRCATHKRNETMDTQQPKGQANTDAQRRSEAALLARMKEWISLPETQEKLKKVAEESIQAGRRLKGAEKISHEMLHRPFDI